MITYIDYYPSRFGVQCSRASQGSTFWVHRYLAGSRCNRTKPNQTKPEQPIQQMCEYEKHGGITQGFQSLLYLHDDWWRWLRRRRRQRWHKRTELTAPEHIQHPTNTWKYGSDTRQTGRKWEKRERKGSRVRRTVCNRKKILPPTPTPTHTHTHTLD